MQPLFIKPINSSEMKNISLIHFLFFISAFGYQMQTTKAQQNVCKSSTENYKIQNPTLGSTFIWSVDVGGIIVPVSGTSSEINVNWGNTIGTSVLSVYETNLGGCVGETAQLTVVRNEPPTAIITGDATLCAVNLGSVVTIQLTGIAPWNLVYTVNGLSTTETGIAASPFTIPAVALGTTKVYNLVSVTNAACTATTSSTATITVLPALNALQIIRK